MSLEGSVAASDPQELPTIRSMSTAVVTSIAASARLRRCCDLPLRPSIHGYTPTGLLPFELPKRILHEAATLQLLHRCRVRSRSCGTGGEHGSKETRLHPRILLRAESTASSILVTHWLVRQRYVESLEIVF